MTPSPFITNAVADVMDYSSDTTLSLMLWKVSHSMLTNPKEVFMLHAWLHMSRTCSGCVLGQAKCPTNWQDNEVCEGMRPNPLSESHVMSISPNLSHELFGSAKSCMPYTFSIKIELFIYSKTAMLGEIISDQNMFLIYLNIMLMVCP